MAVAAPTSGSSPAQQSAGSLGLLPMSVLGSLLVIVAAGLVLNVIPALFGSGTVNRPMGVIALQVLTQFAALVGLGYGVAKLGTPALKTSGIRGGVFFTLIAAGLLALCGVGLYRIGTRGFTAGGILAMILLAVIVALVIQFYRTGRFAVWAVAMDEGNWFDVTSYKRTQGLKVRRLTTLGLLLLTGSGIWTLWTHNYLPMNGIVKVVNAEGKTVEIENRLGDWVLGGVLEPNPARIVGGFTLMPDLAFTIPLLLTAVALWFSWRAVNFPPFADFLIATEAEINKVSWPTRKSLIRDTIVVLVSLVLITLFLFVVDVFWGFVLSREWVSVLPTASERQADKDKTAEVKAADW